MNNLEDFRTISFLIEENDDFELYNFLIKDISSLNCIDKFLLLLKNRSRYLDDTVSFINESGKQVNLNMNIFLNNFKKEYKEVKNVLYIDEFSIGVDYPMEIFHENNEELIMDCVEYISFKNNTINFKNLCINDKRNIFQKLPVKIVGGISNYISCQKPFKLLDEILDLKKIEISFFDNSCFYFIKSLYSYYSSETILETVFHLSRRISDVGYIISRTPKEINQLIKLYSEEVEKMNKDTKS